MPAYSPVIPNVTQSQDQVLLANGWVLEIPDAGLVSPNFQRIEGLDREVEQVEAADGGTGLIRKYHGGVVRYADITAVRIRDNSQNDAAMSTFVDNYFANGQKHNGVFTKYHHGTVIRRINFIGLGAKKETWPSYNSATAASEEMTYPMSCDMYQEVFVSAA